MKDKGIRECYTAFVSPSSLLCCGTIRRSTRERRYKGLCVVIRGYDGGNISLSRVLCNVMAGTHPLHIGMERPSSLRRLSPSW